MARLAITATLVIAAATGCSTTPSTSSTGATPATTSPSTTASVVATPTSSETASTETTPSQPSAAESLGQDIGAKIGFYAVAKAAGMDDSAKMDQSAKLLAVKSSIDHKKLSVNNTVNVTSNVSITDITRRLVSFRISQGTNQGGFVE